MKRMLGFLTAAILLSAGALPAQNLVGNWQGTLGAPPNALRVVLRIASASGGGLSASLLSIDQGGWDNQFVADSVTLRDSTFAFFMSDIGATYRGTLKGRGRSGST